MSRLVEWRWTVGFEIKFISVQRMLQVNIAGERPILLADQSGEVDNIIAACDA